MPNPEEYRRTRRIVDLLLRVANQPRRWTRRDLAELYELSEKQLDKDVLLVRHGLRMPLRHSAQGYYFERLTTLPCLTLTLPEALSLLLAARLGQQMPGISRGDLAAAIARVGALLPSELLPLVAGLEGNGRDEGPRGATVRELQLAIAERATLTILYRSASREGPATRRDVDPYTLLPYLNSWYLVAFCHERREVRIFKVDRIQEIQRTGERFRFPGDFDLGGYLGSTWGLLRGEAGEPVDVVLEFAPETARWARDQEWHPHQQVEELSDGRMLLRLHTGITPELRRWVLGFGHQVRVVGPPDLAEWVRKEGAAILAGNGGALSCSEVR